MIENFDDLLQRTIFLHNELFDNILITSTGKGKCIGQLINFFYIHEKTPWSIFMTHTSSM